MERLLTIFVLITAVRSATYDVSISKKEPTLQSSTNLRCRVTDAVKVYDSIIVWYQEREIYDGDMQKPVYEVPKRKRILAWCRTINDTRPWRVNADSEVPRPIIYVTRKVCNYKNFNLGLDITGLQNMGDYWCYHSVLDGTELIKMTGDLIEIPDLDKFKSAASQKLTVTPIAPKADLPDGQALAFLHSSAELKCNSDTSGFSNKVLHSWKRERGNKEPKLTGDFTLAPGGTFIINNVTTTDAGDYYCTAKSEGVERKGTTSLKVAEMPEIIPRVNSKFVMFTVPKKSDIVMNWVFYGVKPGSDVEELWDSSTVKFETDDMELSYPSQFTKAYHGGRQFYKTYTYLTGTKPFPRVSQSEYYPIQAQFPPDKVELLPSSGLNYLRATEGRGVDMKCSSEGGGFPASSLLWSQTFTNGTKRSLAADGYATQWELIGTPQQAKSNTFETFDRLSNGSEVTCSASDDSNRKASLMLEVYWFPDVIFRKTPDNETLRQGVDVTLKCTAEGGYPDKFRIQLSHDGRTQMLVNGEYEIKTLTQSMGGEWTCTVSSDAGEMTKTLLVNVQKVPLTLKEIIGTLIWVLLVVAIIVVLITAFFCFFMYRPKATAKRMAKPCREPRFRPSKEMRAERKQQKQEKKQQKRRGSRPVSTGSLWTEGLSKEKRSMEAVDNHNDTALSPDHVKISVDDVPNHHVHDMQHDSPHATQAEINGTMSEPILSTANSKQKYTAAPSRKADDIPDENIGEIMDDNDVEFADERSGSNQVTRL